MQHVRGRAEIMFVWQLVEITNSGYRFRLALMRFVLLSGRGSSALQAAARIYLTSKRF